MAAMMKTCSGLAVAAMCLASPGRSDANGAATAPQPKTSSAYIAHPTASAAPVKPDTEAMFDSHPAPAYPHAELCDGKGGTVILLSRIDEKGNPSDVRIEKSSGSWALDRAARDAAHRWTFHPKLRHGLAVSSVVSVPITFAPQGASRGCRKTTAPRLQEANASASNGPPLYPRSELCEGVGGNVLLLMTLDAHGKPVRVSVEKTSANHALDRAAVDAAKGWTFAPALRNGVAVGNVVRVPVTFDPGSDRKPMHCPKTGS